MGAGKPAECHLFRGRRDTRRSRRGACLATRLLRSTPTSPAGPSTHTHTHTHTHITEFQIRPRARWHGPDGISTQFRRGWGDASFTFIHFWFSLLVRVCRRVPATVPCTKHNTIFDILHLSCYVYLLVCIMCFFPFSLLSNMGHAYGELATSFFAAFDFGFGFFFGESSRLAILSRFCEK